MMKKVLSYFLMGVLVAGLTACSAPQEPTAEVTENPQTEAAENSQTEMQQEAQTEVQTEAGATVDAAAIDIPEVIGSDEEATFTICTYYGSESTTYAEFAAEQIKKKFPNVTLEFEAYPQDGGQTIKTRAATGDLPEILLVDAGTAGVLAESGNIIDLTEYKDKFNIGNYYTDAIMNTTLYSPDGNIWQFPMGSISPILWYYNKQIFADNNIEVPTNYEELVSVVESFNEKGIAPIAMFGKEPWPLGAFFDSFVVKANEGGCYALSEGEAKASDEDIKEAIEKMGVLIEKGIFQEGATNTDFDTADALFKGGQAAMIINGSWYTGGAVEEMGDNLGIITSYPTADAGKENENPYAMTGGGDISGMAVTDSAENKELAAAVAFLFAYYREVAQYEMSSLVTTPLKTDNLVLENELDSVSQELLEVVDQYSYGTKFLHVLPNTEFATSFTEEMQKFLVGETTEDFINNVDGLIEKTVN